MGFFFFLSNSTRLRMRSLNCVPEDMSCGRATAHAAVAWKKKRLQPRQEYEKPASQAIV